MCTRLKMENKSRRRRQAQRADSPRPRQEASSIEPTVHGSCPKEFLFCSDACQCRKRDTEDETYPVKAGGGALGHVELGPCLRNEDGSERDEL